MRMRRPSNIAPDLTIREVAMTWPGCAAVPERYPLTRSDRRWSLQELWAFARAASLDEGQLLAELADAARVPVAAKARPIDGGSPVPLIFLATPPAGLHGRPAAHAEHARPRGRQRPARVAAGVWQPRHHHVRSGPIYCPVDDLRRPRPGLRPPASGSGSGALPAARTREPGV